ncbi:unnamed protein product [Euphydryas editha]|uniref:Uncharacterized protein n=1 Tax=Euphydryas editha TaxID=104508 RepID=A0AAU9TLF4_EUPED|nr:unnamed protein product [Euphydryas editha]
MKTFHDAATVHYIRSSQLFHTTPCRAPALFLLSASDPVGAERSNRSAYEGWCKMGMQVMTRDTGRHSTRHDTETHDATAQNTTRQHSTRHHSTKREYQPIMNRLNN